MGTKIEYSINLLAAAAAATTSMDNNNLTVNKSLNVWENKGDNQIGAKNLQFSSMERMVDTNNIGSIRRTMQMHEDIFKHQVEELHRVYRVQKLLMDELKKKEITQKKPWNQPETTTNPQAHRKDDMSSRDNRSSGSCSGQDLIVTTKVPERGFDLEMPAKEEGEGECPRFGEGEAGPSSFIEEEEIELDLTLGICGSNNNESKKKKKKNAKGDMKLNLWGSFKSDKVGEYCSDPTTPMSSSSVTFEQERKESNWIISQGLKLTQKF